MWCKSEEYQQKCSYKQIPPGKPLILPAHLILSSILGYQPRKKKESGRLKGAASKRSPITFPIDLLYLILGTAARGHWHRSYRKCILAARWRASRVVRGRVCWTCQWSHKGLLWM